MTNCISLTITSTAFAILLCTPFAVVAQESNEGDTDPGIAVLENVIETWQRNYLSLKTWEGQAHIEYVSKSARGTVAIERDLEFSLDKENDRLIHLGTRLYHLQASETEDSVLQKKSTGIICALRSKWSTIGVFHSIAQRDAGKQAVTENSRNSRRSWHLLYEEFDPILPLWCDNVPVDVELKNSILSWKARDGVGFQVGQKGDNVLFSTALGRNSTNKHSFEFAKSQGGNPVNYSWEFQSNEGKLTSASIQSQFHKVGDVWLPAAGHYRFANANSSVDVRLVYTEGRVNQPIKEDRFSKNRLAISNDDKLWEVLSQAGNQTTSADTPNEKTSRQAASKSPDMTATTNPGGTNTVSLSSAQYSLVAAAQKVGIALTSDDANRLLPQKESSHDARQIADALNLVGAKASVIELPAVDMIKAGAPFIVQLKDPDHFVTVLETLPDDRVFVSDQFGDGRTYRINNLFARASGSVIVIRHEAKKPPTGDNPSIEFTTLRAINLTILATERSVRFEYPFRNSGTKSLSITSATTQGNPLSIESPTGTIEPGGTGSIVVVYPIDPIRPGFEEEVLVESNDPTKPLVTLRASGRLNTDVRVEPPLVDFDLQKAGKPQTRLLFVRFDHKSTPVTARVAGDKHVSAKVLSQEEFEARKLWEVAGTTPEQLKESPITCVELTLTSEASENLDIHGEVVISTEFADYQNIRIAFIGRVAAAAD
ncbi:MAG: DUF1573 domain-containing protein [Planctomycetaceae bacterium]|nr:DUF1573 domain-containing protein [Planctomycetaceae bacterium]